MLDYNRDPRDPRNKKQFKRRVIIRIIEFILCVICMIFAFVCINNSVVVFLPVVLTFVIIPCTFALITVIDLLSMSQNREIYWTTWIPFTVAGALLFFFVFGMLDLQDQSDILLVIIFAIFAFITALVFLIDLIWFNGLPNPCRRELTVCPDICPARQALYARSLEPPPCSKCSRATRPRTSVSEADTQYPVDDVCCAKPTCPRRSVSRQFSNSHGGTFHVSKEIAPMCSSATCSQRLSSTVQSDSCLLLRNVEEEHKTRTVSVTTRMVSRVTCPPTCPLPETSRSQPDVGGKGVPPRRSSKSAEMVSDSSDNPPTTTTTTTAGSAVSPPSVVCLCPDDTGDDATRGTRSDSQSKVDGSKKSAEKTSTLICAPIPEELCDPECTSNATTVQKVSKSKDVCPPICSLERKPSQVCYKEKPASAPPMKQQTSSCSSQCAVQTTPAPSDKKSRSSSPKKSGRKIQPNWVNPSVPQGVQAPDIRNSFTQPDACMTGMRYASFCQQMPICMSYQQQQQQQQQVCGVRCTCGKLPQSADCCTCRIGGPADVPSEGRPSKVTMSEQEGPQKDVAQTSSAAQGVYTQDAGVPCCTDPTNLREARSQTSETRIVKADNLETLLTEETRSRSMTEVQNECACDENMEPRRSRSSTCCLTNSRGQSQRRRMQSKKDCKIS